MSWQDEISIDGLTAQALQKVYAALSLNNQLTMREWIAKSRAHFVKMVDFAWSKVQIAGA